MNTRQWKLYEFLKDQHDFLSREEIMNQSGLYESENDRTLTSDLQALKENDTIKVATYAIDLPNTSNSSLNEFYESTNSCIVKVGDKISGAGRWVTYVYSEYVQYLIEFKKQ